MPFCPIDIALTLPNGVPLVLIDCTTEEEANWVIAPPPVVPPIPSETFCAATPRLAAQFTCPAPGGAAADAPIERVGFGSAPNRVVAPILMLPSGLNARTPEAIWPAARPAPETTSLGGTAWISAYHWFAVELFNRSSCSVREPPSESDTGTWIVKSGWTPAPEVGL